MSTFKGTESYSSNLLDVTFWLDENASDLPLHFYRHICPSGKKKEEFILQC